MFHKANITLSQVQQIVIEAMKCGPDEYASYCDQKMTRTKRNGSRKQPPNSLELQVYACKYRS